MEPRANILIGLAVVVMLVGSAKAATAGKGIGDGNDGNRSEPVHVITLYDDLGNELKPGEEFPRPVSMKNTCGKCHNYATISGGWHFNSCRVKPEEKDGRIGEPWVLRDSGTRTMIPISNRGWEGAFRPSQINLSSWQWLKLFGTHYPGGNYGEIQVDPDSETADPEAIIRQPISGLYEINCLVCHSADGRQDQGSPDGAAMQVARQNYRWVATVGAGLGTVKGTASAVDEFSMPIEPDQAALKIVEKIKTTYDSGKFDTENKVFFDIVRQPSAQRCYFCHSTQTQIRKIEQVQIESESEKKIEEHEVELTEELDWVSDEDVHLASGLTCTDCHRNGDDHMITRGDIEHEEGSMGAISTLSCRGCHLGDETADAEAAQKGGRLGAPHPKHPGIPTIHFEELSCTACHSGPMPTKEPTIMRTARIHKLGLHGKHAINLPLPHVMSPVFVRGQDHKIAPHKMFWPAFWGIRNEEEFTPMLPEDVAFLAEEPLQLTIQSEDRINDWRPLTTEQIKQTLLAIQADLPQPEGEDVAVPLAVYVAGGKIYQLSEGNPATENTEAEFELVAAEHEAIKPYSWPIAHNVRPATQSLGVGGECGDCHSTDSPFFFGQVAMDTPVAEQGEEGWAQQTETRNMVSFQDIDETYIGWFNWSFVFRPMMKETVLLCCAVIAAVLLLYSLRALRCLAKAVSDECQS
ncbi:MAG: cytochrome c3 family protein [Sedimentisphaerales bacterium]|nr:cytochrome c3 family protein [Sedimentisphaerales bacterium]